MAIIYNADKGQWVNTEYSTYQAGQGGWYEVSGMGSTEPVTQQVQAPEGFTAEQTAATQKVGEAFGHKTLTQEMWASAEKVKQAFAPAEEITPTDTKVDIEQPRTADTTAFTQGIMNEVNVARTNVEKAYQDQIESLRKQQEESQKRINELMAQQKDILDKADPTQRATWEQEQRIAQNRLDAAEAASETLRENYLANQASIGELENLLNRAMTDIQTAEAVTGLSSIRSPRIAKIKEDYAARASIIEAVMAARNNQIGVAQDMINQGYNTIQMLWGEQLNYYQSLYNFYQTARTEEGNKLINLTAQERQYINAQIGLLENDLSRAEQTADYIRNLMINPQTAAAMEGAGVKLTDSIEVINQKLAQYSYQQEVQEMSNQMQGQGWKQVLPGQTAPARAQTYTHTDSRGNTSTWYAMPEAGPTAIQRWSDPTAGISYEGPQRKSTDIPLNDAARATASPEIDWYANQVRSGQMKISNVPANIRNDVARVLSQEPETPGAPEPGAVAAPNYIEAFQKLKDLGYTRTQVENSYIAMHNQGKYAAQQISTAKKLYEIYPEIRTALHQVYEPEKWTQQPSYQLEKFDIWWQGLW